MQDLQENSIRSWLLLIGSLLTCATPFPIFASLMLIEEIGKNKAEQLAQYSGGLFFVALLIISLSWLPGSRASWKKVARRTLFPMMISLGILGVIIGIILIILPNVDSTFALTISIVSSILVLLLVLAKTTYDKSAH